MNSFEIDAPVRLGAAWKKKLRQRLGKHHGLDFSGHLEFEDDIGVIEGPVFPNGEGPELDVRWVQGGEFTSRMGYHPDNLEAVPERVVTVYADASYCQDTGLFAWAAAVVEGHEGEPLRQSGTAILARHRSSCYAEMTALCNGVDFAMGLDTAARPITRLHVYTDNEAAHNMAAHMMKLSNRRQVEIPKPGTRAQQQTVMHRNRLACALVWRSFRIHLARGRIRDETALLKLVDQDAYRLFRATKKVLRTLGAGIGPLSAPPKDPTVLDDLTTKDNPGSSR